ncbi:G2/mitotic-specific cyclin [Boothiomyces macroporosus]|uniref:G2/mitotic-specific cyclin n=1 Tax=Boothiomyces macroporosus TaxID=261099 RepID=A0AAD5UBN9_9FUNG|nr:G2/mitotic-specific cyclin [Boothiomyces macroporosus]
MSKNKDRQSLISPTMFATQSRVLRARPQQQNVQIQKEKEKKTVKPVKRAALGDLSNVQKQQPAKKKPVAKPVAKKKVVKKEVEKRKTEEQIDKPEVQVQKKARTIDHDDLDLEDMHDPVMVSEYVDDIFDYLRELEKQCLPNADYMDMQKELQWKMRTILIDWLIEVHVKFRLLPETLYLAVNIIDRFLSLRVVALQKLQLVGVTSLFIASKYEEVVSPSIQNFLYMAEDGYTEDEIVKAERYVLQVLKFGLQYPTPMSFLRRSSKADDYDIQTRTLAKYLMEISLVDHRFLVTPASLVAASAHYLARHMLNRGPWNKNLIHYSGYQEHEMSSTVQLYLEYLLKNPQNSLFKKYSRRNFMKGAIFVKNWIETHKSNGLHPIPDHEMNVDARNANKLIESEEDLPEEEEADTEGNADADE